MYPTFCTMWKACMLTFSKVTMFHGNKCRMGNKSLLTIANFSLTFIQINDIAMTIQHFSCIHAWTVGTGLYCLITVFFFRPDKNAPILIVIQFIATNKIFTQYIHEHSDIKSSKLFPYANFSFPLKSSLRIQNPS